MDCDIDKLINEISAFINEGILDNIYHVEANVGIVFDGKHPRPDSRYRAVAIELWTHDGYDYEIQEYGETASIALTKLREAVMQYRLKRRAERPWLFDGLKDS
jgi:hypothetical protein